MEKICPQNLAYFEQFGREIIEKSRLSLSEKEKYPGWSCIKQFFNEFKQAAKNGNLSSGERSYLRVHFCPDVWIFGVIGLINKAFQKR